jgi:moderate conductance mechanosensitive channel
MSPLAFVATAASVPAQVNPETEACGPPGQRSWLCSSVYNVSDNQRAAEIADWFATPLRILIILLVGWIVARLVRRLIRRAVAPIGKSPKRKDPMKTPFGFIDTGGGPTARRVQRAKTMADVLGSVVTGIIWTIAALVAMGELGIDLAPLVAGAGVLGVALGFGAQSLVRDFLSGFFMLAEDQYGVGDVIDVGGVVGSSGGVSGTVEGVSLRTTRIRDVEGVVWHVPNGEIKRVGNKSQQWSRAVLDIPVDYDTDISRATTVIKETADAMWRDDQWKDAILTEPEVWGIEELTPTSVKIRLVVQTLPLEQWRVARELRARIKAAFDAAGIETPRETITYRRDTPPPPIGDDRPAGGGEGDR